MKKFFCFLLLIFQSHCLSQQLKDDKSTVTFSWHERGRALSVLVKDLGLIPRMQPPDAAPYSDNALGAVWVGIDFPFDKAIKIILWARNYYLELRFFALSDMVSKNTNIYNQDLYLGGSTRKALRLNLLPWTERDFQQLKKVTSKEQFHNFIRNHYNKSKDNNHSQNDDSDEFTTSNESDEEKTKEKDKKK